ncbi:MAG TPA: FAD-dependent oxidoreductase [Candidatus Rubneribacter avistercoris]|nr:FAD-dependent oxidoreductase [Candidatus Rubneribacter avistercoris]
MEFARRDFLKGAAAAGALAGFGAIGVLGGCSAAGNGSDAQAKDETAAVASGSDNEEARALSLVECESDVAGKVKERLECDIAVLGGGGSGLSAAVRAAELGARVIVLEKGSSLGGSTIGTEGMFGWGSKLQQQEGVELSSVAELVEEENVFTNYRCDAVLWNKFITSSGKSADWLMDEGYVFDGVDIYKQSVSSFKCFHWWADQSGQTLIDFLAARAEELGVDVRLETPGVCLKTDNGAVAGVYAHDAKSDAYLEVSAKAVIAGCGGYAVNTALIEQLTDWDMTYANATATGTGDAVIMAEDVGAGTYMTSILPAIHVYGYVTADPIVVGCCNQPLLFLNQDGNRCMDESLFIHAHKALFVNAILSQKKCFCVFDQAMVDRFESGEGIFSAWRTFAVGSNIENFQGQVNECIEKGMGNAFVADTIEELAAAMEVDAEAMRASVDRYNDLCERGVDEDYLKDPAYLMPVEQGPFYAIRLDPSVTNTIGGLDVDYHNQVLDVEGSPIPGLYCVGVDGNKLYKETYNYAMSGGLVSFAIYSGLTAGEHAFSTYVS